MGSAGGQRRVLTRCIARAGLAGHARNQPAAHPLPGTARMCKIGAIPSPFAHPPQRPVRPPPPLAHTRTVRGFLAYARPPSLGPRLLACHSAPYGQWRIPRPRQPAFLAALPNEYDVRRLHRGPEEGSFAVPPWGLGSCSRVRAVRALSPTAFRCRGRTGGGGMGQ